MILFSRRYGTLRQKKMGFNDRPVGRNEKEFGQSDTHRNPTQAEPDTETELKELCSKNSHPQYPFLRDGYSPVSRYPAVDFTPWIVKKLTEQRFEHIAFLLAQLTQANPGVGVGSEYWHSEALRICTIDLRREIVFDDDKATVELHAALFPYVLHCPLNGLMIVDDRVGFLARVVSPYAFSVCRLEAKVTAANELITKMKQDLRERTTVWSDYPLFRVDSLRNVLQSKPPAPRLRAMLREVTVGARQLFFGTLKDGPGQGHWIARPYGIDEEKAAMELVDLGLGQTLDDPSLVLTSYRNDELLAALSSYPTKQGWKKKYIINYILENAREVIESLTMGKRVFILRAESTADGAALADWTGKIKPLLSIAMGFTG